VWLPLLDSNRHHCRNLFILHDMKALIIIMEHSDHSGYKVLRVYDATDRALAEADVKMLQEADPMHMYIYSIQEAPMAGNI
jgi:hypothetical protein